MGDYRSRSFFVALTIVGVVSAGIFAYVRWYPNPEARVERTERARDGGQAAATKQAPVIATVYECDGPQGRVFSDQPCADDAKIREVRAPNRLSGEPEPGAETAGSSRERPRYPAR